MSGIRRPRVGYVLKRYPRYSETFIVNEILAHEAAGLDIRIFALRPPSDTHFQDRISRVRAPVSYVPSNGVKASQLWSLIRSTSDDCPEVWSVLEDAQSEDVRDVCQALWLARELRAHRISHVHAHFATVATTVSRIAARITRSAYSLTAHAKDIFHEDVDDADLRRKFSDASTVVTVSDYNLAYLRDRFEKAAGRVQRIYNGLDLSEFSYEEPAEREPVIVAVGRLVEKKGFGDLIEACDILRRRGRVFRCSIIGGGELDADLRAKVSHRRLESLVEICGPRPQAEVIERVRSAAILAAPCVIGADANRDGLPTVLLEAMALGTPCISTDVTGIPEVIRHERTGLMIPQRDPAALAAAIERLLDDGDLRVHVSSSARQLIETEFDIHRNAAELRDVFGRHGGVEAESAVEAIREVS